MKRGPSSDFPATLGRKGVCNRIWLNAIKSCRCFRAENTAIAGELHRQLQDMKDDTAKALTAFHTVCSRSSLARQSLWLESVLFF